MRTKRRNALGIILACALAAAPVVLIAQPAAAPGDVDPDALAALNKMGAYLRTLKAFQVQSDSVKDEVLVNGERVSYGGKTDLLVARPDKLRVEITSDRQHRIFLYDGKTFTLFAGRLGYYATVPAPPTLAELVDRLADKYDIEVPLVDLFYWGSDRATANKITSATDIGPSEVNGMSCEHYTFRQPGIDWQVWIQLGDYPLPRKLVITTTTDDAKPEYSTVMNWNLAPSFNEEAFKFDPPPGAMKIKLAEVAAGGK